MRDGTFHGLDDAVVVGSTSADQRALSALVNEVYWLALRMLWHPSDAERATREIFGAQLERPEASSGRAVLRLRVLRAAVRHLLGSQKSPFERQAWTFEALADDLSRGFDEVLPNSVPPAQNRVLEDELQVGCTQTMLQCLAREERMIYLLGDVLCLDATTAGYVAGLSRHAFSERLLHARDRVERFMQRQCGILNPDRPCRCGHRLGRALQTGRVDRRRLLFVLPAPPERDLDLLPPRADPARIFRAQLLRPAPAGILRGLTSLVHAQASAALLGSVTTRRRQRERRVASSAGPSLSLVLTTRAVKARH